MATRKRHDFAHDVFLSYSSKDKPVVRKLAQRLRNDGVKVWFDEWEIKPGDRILERIEAGLEASRDLVLFISMTSMGSDWAELEGYTFRFVKVKDKGRRFIPVRLDNARIKESLQQYLYLNWRERTAEQYACLLAACSAGKRVTDRPSIARVYDYFLGGCFNTAADRLAAKELLNVYPNFKKVLVSNRAFLRRAVRFLAEMGIKQFLDIGSGLPTRGNTHEIAQAIHGEARVVYIDVDKQVVDASRTLLQNQPNVGVILADLERPRSILVAWD